MYVYTIVYNASVHLNSLFQNDDLPVVSLIDGNVTDCYHFISGNFEEIEVYSLEPVTRAKHWQDVNYVPRECQGKLVRGICVFGIGDVPWLATRREIIANKFHLTFDHYVMDCLEERHRNRTVSFVGSVSPDFDMEFYKNLPTVKYSRKNGISKY